MKIDRLIGILSVLLTEGKGDSAGAFQLILKYPAVP